jgi:hypothetical protein
MNASTHSSGVSQRGRPDQIEAIQPKIWIPQGRAMTMLAAV